MAEEETNPRLTARTTRVAPVAVMFAVGAVACVDPLAASRLGMEIAKASQPQKTPEQERDEMLAEIRRRHEAEERARRADLDRRRAESLRRQREAEADVAMERAAQAAVETQKRETAEKKREQAAKAIELKALVRRMILGEETKPCPDIPQMDDICRLNFLENELLVAAGGEPALLSIDDWGPAGPRLVDVFVKKAFTACGGGSVTSTTAFASFACSGRDGRTRKLMKRIVDTHLRKLQRYRSPEGFGDARWGMTPKEVRRVERVRRLGADLEQPITVAGHKGKVRYIFSDGHLVTVRLTFGPRLDRAALAQFFDLRSLLAQKYGEPEDIRVGNGARDWARLDEVDRSHIAAEVITGDADLLSEFTTKETAITLRASGQRAWPGTTITYASRHLWGWHEAEQKARITAEASKL